MEFWLTFNLIDSLFSCMYDILLYHIISRLSMQNFVVYKRKSFSDLKFLQYRSTHVMTPCAETERYQILSLKTFFLLHQKTTMIKFYFYFIWRKGNHYIWVLIWKDVDRDKFLLYLLLECIDLFLGWYYENSVFKYMFIFIYRRGITRLNVARATVWLVRFWQIYKNKNAKNGMRWTKIKLFSYHYFTNFEFSSTSFIFKLCERIDDKTWNRLFSKRFQLNRALGFKYN